MKKIINLSVYLILLTLLFSCNRESTFVPVPKPVPQVEPHVTCSPEEVKLEPVSQILELKIATNTDYSVEYDSDWLSESFRSKNVLAVAVAENRDSVVRTGRVTLRYYGLDGTRKQCGCVVSQNPKSYFIATYDIATLSDTVILKNPFSVDSMYIDGGSESVPPSTSYHFGTVGEHKVKFVLKSGLDTLSSMFDSVTTIVHLDGTHFFWPQIKRMHKMFNRCKKLRNVEGLENWIVGGSEEPTMAAFQLCSSYQHLVLPRTTVISAFMINHLSSIDNTSITIPASVERIDCAHVFYHTGKDGVFTEFIVESGNTCFKTIDGSLYSMDGKDFIASPLSPVVQDSTFVLAEGVERLGELCFNREKTFTRLLLPDSYVITEYCNGQNTTSGINWGNSLSVALYSYTAVREYAVKNSNPRYSEYDGCIYSKDGTRLIAVPTNKKGVVTVKDGCEHVNAEAFWEEALNQVNVAPLCSGITIPASVTDISAGQLSGINNMVEKKKWIVTISPENPVYRVDEDGKIAVRP